MPIRIIISDSVLTGHPVTVRTAINTGYGSDISDQIEIRAESLNSSLNYCKSVGGVIVVRSMTGMATSINTAQTWYNSDSILTVMPMGSNSPIEINPPASIPVIVTTGTPGSAYGPGLEFIDDDLGDPAALSSWSNGIIAGKLLKIKDLTGADWWSVRYRARQTASNYGIRNDLDGYGVIDVTAAASYSIPAPTDPYFTGTVTDIFNDIRMAIKRQSIIEAVKTRLETILIENNYKTDLGNNIYLWKLEPWEQAETPGAIIRDKGLERVGDQGNQMAGTSVYDLDLEIEIGVSLENESGTSEPGQIISETLRKCIRDVYEAFENDLTFGGLVMMCEQGGDTMEITADEGVKGSATIQLTVRFFTTTWKEE